MSLLLCAATSFEISTTLQFIKEQQLDKQITVLFTGVGLMATTYALTKQVYHQRPGCIIQAGIGGAIDESLQLTHVVAVQSDCVGDLGVREASGFKDLFSLGFEDKNSFPFKNGALINQTNLLKVSELPLVKGVSVNEISTHPDTVTYYREIIGAQVESMEGAALHFLGLQENIPFLQIRSISNYIGERNKQAWKLQEAIDTLNVALQQLISKQLRL